MKFPAKQIAFSALLLLAGASIAHFVEAGAAPWHSNVHPETIVTPSVATPADGGESLMNISRSVEAYSPSQIEQVKAINGWVYTTVGAIGLTRKSNSVAETLTLLDGTCANRADLAAAISSQLGLKTRRVNFYGIPVQVGHSAWEVLINGKWRFFDSLFGVYFARPDDLETPISIDEARAEFPHVVMMKSINIPWRGKTMPIEQKYKYSAQDMSVPVIDPFNRSRLLAIVKETYFGAHYSKSGDDSLYKGKFYINLDQNSEGTIGEVDGKLDDMVSPYPMVGPSQNYNPFAFLLGYYEAGGGPRVAQQFNFITSKHALVRVTIHFTQDIPEEDRQLFTAQFDSALPMNQMIGNGEFQWGSRSASIELTVSSPFTSATISLVSSTKTRFWNIDAIEWSTIQNAAPALTSN